MENILGYFGALFIGLIIGLLGGGGSILTVPLLVYLLAYNPVIATAYSLFVVGTSALIGAIQKYKNGNVDIKTGLAFSFPSFIAVYVSRRFLVPAIPNEIFTIQNFILTKDILIIVFFAIIMLIASISMIKKRKRDLKNLHYKQPYYKTFLQGITIGVITGLIGAGGGFLYVPALVLWANLPMKKAVGTSLVIVSFNSLIGFTGDMQTLEIDWNFLWLFTSLTIAGVIIGGRLSNFIPNTVLKKGFGYLILLMSFYILLKELYH